MSGRGYYRMARGWLDHPMFFKRRYCERAAWAWLVEQAAFSGRDVRIGGKTVRLARGQLCHSIRFLAQAWRWSPRQVGRFLAKLEKWHAIATASTTASATAQTIITISNYSRYQADSNGSATASATGSGTQAPQKRIKEDSSSKEEGAPAPVLRIDSAKPVFETGKALLSQYGHPAPKAGALIQRWRRELGDDQALLAILSEAGSAQRHDIAAFVSGCIRNRKRGERGRAAPTFGSPEHAAELRKWGAI